MPDFTVSPLSVVNQIKSNLQDRYDSGFPILKELLQNADDAGARRFRLDAWYGWPEADNPLLRGPGLLVVNDGGFRQKDRCDILAFGVSGKVTDHAAIGKFGLGQKAVFHLCDAFVVHAFNENEQEPFSRVVNPFLNVDAPGNVTGGWEHLKDSDVNCLRRTVSDNFDTRGLVLWLPFRSERLRPAPALSFSTNRPSISGTVDELAKTEELQTLLTILRHLESIEIRKQDGRDSAPTTCCFVCMGERTERLRGPQELRFGTRRFGGGIHYKDASEPAPFVGREATNPNHRLTTLQRSDHWPKANSVLDAQPKPEKGEPHGAATLLRMTNDLGLEPNELTISWAVFLPISDQENTTLQIRHHAASGRFGDASDLGRFRLLLHGYFFLDSGRRRIDGLTQSAPTGAPSSNTELHRAWNVELRDSVVLPLIPVVLNDALDSKMVTPAEFAALTAAIAQDDWFKDNRCEVCRHMALVRTLNSPAVVTWHLVPAGTAIRPVPTSVSNHPERMQELFEEVHRWADERGIVLCVDPSASLTAEPMHWTVEELGCLFSGLPSRVFSSRALASLLVDFLHLTVSGDEHRRTTAPHVVSALRAALCATVPLAPSEQLAGILEHIPHAALFPLPKGVEHRQVLRALAGTDATILPVRGAWVPDSTPQSRIPQSDLEALLRTLEPLIESTDADSPNLDIAAQAATAALALLDGAGSGISALANDARFADIKVLRGRAPRTGRVLALSIKNLVDRSREGLLFGPSPQANELLPLLVCAAPDAAPVIVEGRTVEYLKRPSEGGRSALRPLEAGKEAVLAIINRTSRFGDESDRAKLLDGLKPTAGDDWQALRRLCAGTRDAGAVTAELRVLDHTWNGIERIVKEVLGRQSDCFLIPSRIAEELSTKLRRHLDIDVLDAPGIEVLLEGNLDTISRLRPTESERETLLLTDLSDSLLQRLPIHARSDGTVGGAVGIYQETDWPIPAALAKDVVTVQPCRNAEARDRQEKLVRPWSPTTQIETALRRTEPHVFRKEILDALTKLPTPSEENDPAFVEQLREIRWLVADGVPVSPDNVLALSPGVDEQARLLLPGGEEHPAFVPVDALPIDIRRHAGFKCVKKHLLPDADASLDALTEMIDDAGLVGYLGAEDDRVVDDLAALARNGANLALPGWPLLAAVLAPPESDRKPVRGIVSSFSQLADTEHEIAAGHLDALAELAQAQGTLEGQAARRVYDHGFTTIAGWPEGKRRKVLRGTRVPTVAGVWRVGREVIADDNGLAATHVLDRACAEKIPTRTTGDESAPTAIPNGVSGAPEPSILGHRTTRKLADLDKESAAQQREFLLAWSRRVPEDLIVVYLGLIGRYPALLALAEELCRASDVVARWRELDEELDTILRHHSPQTRNPMGQSVDARRFLLAQIDGKSVSAIALSGDVFEAPVDKAAFGLLVGNRHTRPRSIYPYELEDDGNESATQELLVELPLQQIDPSILKHQDAVAMFRQLVERVAVDCYRIKSQILKKILDRAVHVNQTTLEETEHLLCDRAPTILGEMKLPVGSRCQNGLRKFEEGERQYYRTRAGAKDMVQLKRELWQCLDDSDAAAELLLAVRARITDLGYSVGRVVFELFQNADDAYEQLDDGPVDATFRVEILPGRPGGFRTIHWGRLINDPGTDVNAQGRDRDLLNMLVMNFSEKRPREALTGKFGLGFKSVHLLSDSVGIASRFLSLRTSGGFLPKEWPGGIDLAEEHRRDPSHATVIDVPFTADTAASGEASVRVFRSAANWLAAFAHQIRRIQIQDGNDPTTIECTIEGLIDDQIDVVTISEAPGQKQRALSFSLGDGYRLLVRIEPDGPTTFPVDLPRLWNLAPLEEDLRTGWLLNGPFPVDPGRGRLAGSIEHRQDEFRRRGRALGDRLLAFADFAKSNWTRVVTALALDSSEQTRANFWSRFFDVMSRDFNDDLARFLHAEGCGYRRFVSERSALPTGLSQPFDHPVCASDIRCFTDGALTNPSVLEQVKRWPTLVELSGRIVAGEVAERLKKLGFNEIRPMALSDLLRREIGEDGRIDAEAGKRLGRVVTLAAIEKGALHPERNTVLDTVRQTKFRARDEAWRRVKDLNSESGGDDEKLICSFAPESALLHPDYHGASLEFFKVARLMSGYGPKAVDLGKWVHHVDRLDRRRAVLRYIISGRQGREMAAKMRDGGSVPAWAPRPLERLLSDSLLDGWRDEDRKRLLIELGGGGLVDVRPYYPNEAEGGTWSKDPVYGQRYKEIRAEIMGGRPMCRFCGRRRATETHHWRYPNSPEELTAEDLTPLCKDCHEVVERFKKFVRTGRPLQDFLAMVDSFVATTSRPPSPILDSKPKEVLARIHDWWVVNRDSERGAYATRVYPSFLSPATLRESNERTPWFTMFALACFQSFGRAQDEQHRDFIEGGYQKGWWQEIAGSRPLDEIQPWLARLEDWSAPDLSDQGFLWRRTFVDLYTVARWLTEYVEIMRKLPRIVRERGAISLNDVLRPADSPVIQPLGLEAAPLNRPLGNGANWLIRECIRNGVYDVDDAAEVALYCWMPSLRVRKLLAKLGMTDLSEQANKEDSGAIHAFIVNHLGEERARFGGDFDLPLQLVTRAGYREVLRQCFEQGGLAPPGFDEDDEDGGNDAGGGDPE